MLPALRDINPNGENDMIYFKGLNRLDGSLDQELYDTLNMSLSSFPSIEVRPKREVIANYTNAQSLFTGVKKAWIDGTNFYYDGVIKGQVTAAHKSMCDFNGRVLIFPDKKYYDYIASPGVFGNLWTGEVEPGYPAEGSVPDIDFVAVHANRVFGVKGSNVYASALGDATSWVDFAGDALDSWAMDVYSEGAFTGIVAHKLRLILLKDDYTYELLGSYPAQFQAYKTCDQGIIDSRSLKEVNGALYGLGREGIKRYDGQWRVISQSLDEGYLGGAAGSDGRRYYISLNTGTGGYKLYVYDTDNGLWVREDDLQVIDFATLDGELFALTSTGDLVRFKTGTTEAISWEVITKNYDEYSFDQKHYTKVAVRFDLAEGSSAKVYVRYDQGAWKEIATLTANSSFAVHKVNIPVYGCNSFQIKVSGTGYAKLHGIKREFYVEVDR